MNLRPRDVLGLAFHDHEVACALLDSRGRLRKAGRFRASDGLTVQKAGEFGAALKAYLHEQGLDGTSTAVAGVPARWLMAEPREVPPADSATQLAGLRLAAERVSLGDDTRLIFDVAGSPPAKGGSAMLVGLATKRVEQITKICEAAGLKVAGITATGLAVAAALPAGNDRTVVLFDGDGAEIIGGSQAGIRTFRHVGGTSKGAASPALQRALSLSGGGDVLLLDGSNEAACAQLAERVHRTVDCREPTHALRDVPALASLNGQADTFARERLWPAVVLADAGRQRTALPVDFLKPRLVAPKASKVDRRWVIGGAIGLVLVGGFATFYKVVSDAQDHADQLDKQLSEQAPQIEAAQKEVDRIAFGKTFFETRPPVLDCIADVARIMGREEPVWLTNLTIRDTGRAALQGRAADQRSVLSLYDRLAADENFQGVERSDLRAGSGQSAGSQTFSVTFTYTPVPPTAPAATKAATVPEQDTQ